MVVYEKQECKENLNFIRHTSNQPNIKIHLDRKHTVLWGTIGAKSRLIIISQEISGRDLCEAGEMLNVLIFRVFHDKQIARKFRFTLESWRMSRNGENGIAFGEYCFIQNSIFIRLSIFHFMLI